MGTASRHSSVMTAPAVMIATTVRALAATTARMMSASTGRRRRLRRSPPAPSLPATDPRRPAQETFQALLQLEGLSPNGGRVATSWGSAKVPVSMYSPLLMAVYPTMTTATSAPRAG